MRRRLLQRPTMKQEKLGTGNVVQAYCQIGAVKPDPHKQQEIFVNKVLTILNNSEIHL